MDEEAGGGLSGGGLGALATGFLLRAPVAGERGRVGLSSWWV